MINRNSKDLVRSPAMTTQPALNRALRSCCLTCPVVLNLFRAVAQFKGPQIFVAHFDDTCDVMMTKLLGLASELMAAEVISKKNYCLPSTEDGQSAGGIGADLQRKIRSFAHPIHGSWSVWLFMCTSISQPHSVYKPII